MSMSNFTLFWLYEFYFCIIPFVRLANEKKMGISRRMKDKKRWKFESFCLCLKGNKRQFYVLGSVVIFYVLFYSNVNHNKIGDHASLLKNYQQNNSWLLEMYILEPVA